MTPIDVTTLSTVHCAINNLELILYTRIVLPDATNILLVSIKHISDTTNEIFAMLTGFELESLTIMYLFSVYNVYVPNVS